MDGYMLKLSFTPDEMERIRRVADREGMTAEDWMADAVMRAVDDHKPVFPRDRPEIRKLDS